jgi:hypothetical protein
MTRTAVCGLPRRRLGEYEVQHVGNVRDAVRQGFRGIFDYGGNSLGVCATDQRYLRGVLPKGR